MADKTEKSDKPERLETELQMNTRMDQDIEDASEWGAEEKRLRGIRAKRQKAGECIMCGKPLGFWDKRARRLKHEACTQWHE
jgi:hypothetical protein